MRNALRGSAIAGALVGGTLLFGGAAYASAAAPAAPADPAGPASAVQAAEPNGCAKVRHITDNGVQVTNVSCGRVINVQVVWSTPPYSRIYAIAPGASRDYYPHFSWQHYETIRIY
ncbi:hypothetical protein [Actinomadura rupiterrae]|uniref:hypothetical protein n=1 Tax=Actinomadura rupiterrae TaxID=559627 RepID=UPI0020A56AD9|nr:hypothetical protein [Actinomadura rupiterrae]MCP2337406.1 hypothetical protein [Actinomadura rupiterrae]